MGEFKPSTPASQLPKNVDYRGESNFGHVKSQADCGSCW